MKQPENNTAKFAFYYMLSLIALIFAALATGMIIFQIINKNIADVIIQRVSDFSPSQLKFAISALIISAPIFYITTWQICKNLFTGAFDKDSGVRKWLTYFVLLVSSVVMLGWLIAIVNNFLDGELTVKFILKAATAIGISAAIFTFYYYDIKREKAAGKKDKIIQFYFYASLAAVIIVFIAGLFIMESPQKTRDRKMDNAILENFDDLNRAIGTYYSDNEKLPANLDRIKSEFSYIGDKDLKNLATGEKYEYKIKSENIYELCATFKTSNKKDKEYNNYQDDDWPHDVGYQCLSQRVSKSK
ncbi:hypothetical protein J7J13_01865 [bacterium]|nr:hypothetical protein [bacterium]